MKLTVSLMLVVCLQVQAVSYAQKVSIAGTNISLAQVLKQIREQTGYNFIFTSDAQRQALPVTMHVKEARLEQALKQCFTGQPLTFAIHNKIIIVKPLKVLPEAEQPALPALLKVSGTVTDEAGNPLAGVTVRVKGSAQGAVTDAKGGFTLDADPGAQLEFSYLGYETQQLALNGRNTLTVRLKATAAGLNQVVVVGYGTVKKKDLTGAVTSLDAGKYGTQSATSLSEFFSGTVAGIASNQGTTARGGGSLELRGVNSLLAETNPLVILDGVIYNGSITDINPQDIETIDILKDASAAAVYGSRAANGVIIVSTKKGKKGLPAISFSATTGYAEAAHNYRPFDENGYLAFREDLFNTLRPQHDYYYHNPFSLPDSVSIDRWRAFSNNPNPNDTIEWLGRLNLNGTEIRNYLAGRRTDWYRKIMQKGLRQNYDVSVSGGSANVSYYFSTGYTRNNGIVRGDEIRMLRSRLNLDAKIADFIRIGVNAQFSGTDSSAEPVGLGNMTLLSPYGSMFNDDGSLKLYPQDDALFRNPFMNNYYKDKLGRTNALFAILYSEVTLPFGFSYRISFQNRLSATKLYEFWPSRTPVGGIEHVNGFGSRRDDHTYEWMVDNIIRWNRAFGRHAFDLTFLVNAEKLQQWVSVQTNENFNTSENLSWHGLQFGSNPTLENNDRVQTGDALMARINYSFKDRYLLTASLRRDGFSAFGQKNPRAYFPAVALAWRISDEPFFKASWVDQLKLRASWGANGNRAIDTYEALAVLTRAPYYNGSQVITGVANTRMANPDLRWEQSVSLNAGFDMNLLNNRLNITADAYHVVTTDLLMRRKLPVIMGYDNMVTNLGKLSNKGIELTLSSVNITRPAFTWRSNFNFTMNRNRIERLWGDYENVVQDGKTQRREVPDYVNGWFPGQSIDRIWTYDITGIWQQNEAAAARRYGLSPGDFKSRDVNGDSAYRQFDDKVFLGWREPRYLLGWRNDFTFWKNLELSVFLRADLGHYARREEFNHSDSNIYDRSNTRALPYWSKDHPSGKYPRLNVNNSAYEGSIFLYEPAGFLRIQDVSLAYNFPRQVIRPLKMSSLRVFMSARNLYAFTGWTGWDPESLNEPMPRIFTLGVNTTL